MSKEAIDAAVIAFTIIGNLTILILLIEHIDHRKRQQMIDAGYEWQESGWFKKSRS